MSTLVWHNPKCTKSRQTVALLEEKGIVFETRLYLDNAPSVEELKTALAALNMEPRALMRSNEELYKNLALKDKDDDTLLAAMHENPKLIQRPVVFHAGKAAIGRPPEDILPLFDA